MNKRKISLIIFTLLTTFSLSGQALATEDLSLSSSIVSSVDEISSPVLDSDFSTSLNSRVVIGTEERTLVTDTTQGPYSAIGYLLVKWPDGTYSRGTAWMAGKYVALTSAHCLYDASHGGTAESITFVPGRNSNLQPFSSYTSSTFTLPSEYTEAGNTNYDYGIIQFNTAIGKTTGYIKPYYNETHLKNETFTVSGYPKYLGTNTSTSYYNQWEHTGTISSYTSTHVYYTMDTSGGDSGAPVFCEVDGVYYSVGIHRGGTSSRNLAIRFNKALYKEIRAIDKAIDKAN